MTIDFATTDEDLLACFPVMAELRPHLVKEKFVETVRRLTLDQQYSLVRLSDDGIKAVAGIRIGEWLYSGRYLEIEEFVTTHDARSRGYGAAFFDWLLNHASAIGCQQLRLVSGVARSDAHRFYKRKGMIHEAQYFTINVPRD